MEQVKEYQRVLQHAELRLDRRSAWPLTELNMRTFALYGLVIIVFTAFAVPVDADRSTTPNGPIGAVKSTVNHLVAVLEEPQNSQEERQQKLRRIAEDNFDLTEIAESTIGHHLKTFTPTQKKEFVPLFTTFLKDALLSATETYSIETVNRHLKRSQIEFVKETPRGSGYAEVFSSVRLEDRSEEIAVNFSMRRDLNQWKIYDINIDGVSTIAYYSGMFDRELNNGGYEGLMKLIRQKVEGLQQIAS